RVCPAKRWAGNDAAGRRGAAPVGDFAWRDRGSHRRTNRPGRRYRRHPSLRTSAALGARRLGYTARVAMKRKADVEGRRRILCDAAIQLLADEGAKGLTHRKVEQRAGLPDGTTSSYFRTRSALLRATAERVAQLDAAEFEAVMQRSDLAETT